MQNDAKWYIVHTYSGYENKVASNLEKIVDNNGLRDLIQEVHVPTEMVTEIKDGKKRDVERKLFPSYVIVKMVMTDETWYIVRNVRGCTGFVGPSSKPVPLTDEEVRRLGVKQKIVEVPYAVGDHVLIASGPLEGTEAIVKKIDIDKNLVHVAISMFGRETPVELELDQVSVES